MRLSEMSIVNWQSELRFLDQIQKLTVFESGAFGQLRIVYGINNEPWFIAREVASALGYKRPNDAVRSHIKDHHKGTAIYRTLGGDQQVTMINESGLYALIMRSKMKKAEAFQEWVTGEVLPSIRKNGFYQNSIIDERRALQSEEAMLKVEQALALAQKQLVSAESEIRSKDESIDKLEALFVDGISICDFCKSLNGVDVQRVQSVLCDLGILVNLERNKTRRPNFQVASRYRDSHFKTRPYKISAHRTSYTALVTKRGAKLLYCMYIEGRLPMKKTWDKHYRHGLI